MKDRIDQTSWLLFGGVFLAVLAIFYSEHHFKDDGQIFQVMASLITGFASSLFTRLKGASTKETSGDDNSIRIVTPAAEPQKEAPNA